MTSQVKQGSGDDLQGAGSRLRPSRFEQVVLLIAAAFIVYQTLIPPILGLADSGDFERTFPQTGLTHSKSEYHQKYFVYFNSKYRIVPRRPEFSTYDTSTTLIIRTARWLSIRAGQDGIFDSRILGVIYASILLTGIWLLLVASRSLVKRLRIVFAALLLLFFADPGVIAYLNTMYSEATAFCFFVLAMGFAAILISKRSSSALMLVGYFVAVAIMTTAKPMYIPLAPLFAIFGIYLTQLAGGRWRYCLSAAMGVMLCWIAFWYYGLIHPVNRDTPPYVGIFMDMLPNSPTPEQDLSALGLDPKFKAYSGITPYQPESFIYDRYLRAEFTAAVNQWSLPYFYISRPSRLYSLCSRCAAHAFSTRIRYLGYYEESTGKQRGTIPFGVWSSVREGIFPRSALFLVFFFATGLIGAAVAIRTRSNPLRSVGLLYLLLTLVAASQFFVSVLNGGGEPDIEKHLFLFNVAFDACVLLLVMGGVRLCQSGWVPFPRLAPFRRKTHLVLEDTASLPGSSASRSIGAPRSNEITFASSIEGSVRLTSDSINPASRENQTGTDLPGDSTSAVD